jgi:hypothetical protein
MERIMAKRIFGTFFIMMVIFSNLSLSAYTLDWSEEGWSAGDLTGRYRDIDGSGVDSRIHFTGDVESFEDNYPDDSDDDNGSLVLSVDFDDNTQIIKTTITFSYAVSLYNLRFRDIDSGSWNDRLIITGKDSCGNIIEMNNVRPGSEVTEVNGSNYESSGNGSLNDDDEEGWLTFDFNETGVTEINFIYTSGSTADSDPGSQVIWFNDIYFEGYDSDGDGVIDSLDSDSDNDGIPDIDEGKNCKDWAISYDAENVDNPENALGGKDGTYATMDSDDDSLILDLGYTVEEGDDIDITMKGASSILFSNTDYDIEASADGNDWTKIGEFTDSSGEAKTKTYQAPSSGARYIRFIRNDYKLDIDSVEYLCPPARDSDGDGLPDYLDLDSDNDGIPDNVEAQSTAGYTAPSGNDSDGDGLDDSYDTDDGGTAVTLPDTDADGVPDYLDTDSDGDGLSDCMEGLPEDTASKYCPVDEDADSPVGDNGLVGWAETSDDYSDVNGVVNNPKEDLQPEESSASEVDFRIFADNDGDGISDFYDIDDDNDGILDSVEIQGGGECVYGFFHMINGQLKIFDVKDRIYLDIGERHININAMGFDRQKSTLYGVAREDGTDDYGSDFVANDILQIDRYSGKIRKANNINGSQLDSHSADFYNGVLYARTALKEISEWKRDDDTVSTITLNEKDKSADFAIDDSNGFPVGFGLTSTTVTSGVSDNTTLYMVDLLNATLGSRKLTVTTPDGNDLHRGWGATFFAVNDGVRELYAANNNGYIYRIDNYNTSSPKAVFVYRSIVTNRNDGASCKDANQYPVDSDGDGIPDYLDLDSDNDGIPDNVEAQSTDGYTAPSGNDSDGDGLDDAYDESDTSGAAGSIGLIPPDTDGDLHADFLDSDSDNDGYSDCEEGLPDATSDKSCPVDDSDVGSNGLVDWAESSDDYSDVNGDVNDPSGDLFNETGDTTEVGYREYLCGKSNFEITAYNWRLISPPCDTGSNSIDDLFGDTLGDYGNDRNWVMYEQSGDDNYEVNSTHDNTNKRMLSSTDTLQVGRSYWIIADSDHILNIPKDLSGLSPTSVTDSSSLGISDENFSEVHETTLPANSDSNEKKYMSGNPFPFSFGLEDLYFRHGSGTYYPMGDSNNDSYIKAVVYKHDSPLIGECDGYVAIDPSTPGFSSMVKPMEGFFTRFEINSDTSTNHFAFPLDRDER